MKVKRTSILTNIIHEREMDITEEQVDLFNMGVKVQHAFPHLSADDREFILNGITEEEWNEHMNDGDDMPPDEDGMTTDDIMWEHKQNLKQKEEPTDGT